MTGPQQQQQAKRTWRPGLPVRFDTARFVVRTLFPRDVDETYTSWWNDPEIQKGFARTPRNWMLNHAKRHVATFNNRNKFHLGIFSKKTGKLIGFFTIVCQPGKVASTNVCIGNKSYWGEDVLLEIKTVALDFIFSRLGMVKAEARIYGRNFSSMYTNKVMGFKPEAIIRQHVRGLGNERVDVYIFGLLKDEWPDAKQRSLKALRAKRRARAGAT